jgi:hypothetical protein
VPLRPAPKIKQLSIEVISVLIKSVDRSGLSFWQESAPGFHCVYFPVSFERLVPFVQESVEPGSVIHTDGWPGYLPLESKGYQHDVPVLRDKKKTPSESMPRVHRVISLLKR